MSTASFVPETPASHGSGDAKETLRATGWQDLLRHTVRRFTAADGTSHVRSLAHAMVLTGLPALLAVIGFAETFELSAFRKVLEHTLKGLAPGSSGRLLSTAFQKGNGAGGPLLLAGGLAGAAIAGTFAMAQIERGFNRIYGLERDRPWRLRYIHAFKLIGSAGLMLALSFLLIVAGGAVSEGLTRALGWSGSGATVFNVLRWVLGLLLSFAGLTLLFKTAPDRKQPEATWLQTATVLATLLWFSTSALLAAYYAINERLSEAYGPLLGVIAALTWSYLSALSLYLGMAFAAQLEAVRAGAPGPRVARRANDSD